MRCEAVALFDGGVEPLDTPPAGAPGEVPGEVKRH